MAAGSEAGQAQTIDVLRQQLESAIAERDEARAQQLALADVLQAINASTGDFSAVFHLILERATSLCDAPSGGLVSVADDHAMALANHGMPQALIDYWSRPQYVDPNTAIAKVLRLGKTLHQADMAASEMYRGRVPMSVAGVELGGIRSYIMVPLVNERGVIGLFVLYRPEVRPFSDRQIALVEAFAAQAAVAMENARLLTEQREALEQQTATAEVLEVINASPGNLEPVFGVMLEKAMRLCEAAFGIFGRFDGKLFEPVVDRGVPPELIATTRQIQSPPPNSGLGRLAAGEAVVQLVDLANTDVYRAGFVGATALVDIGGAKTAIFVALRKDGVLRGVLVMYRREVRAFSDKQVALLQNFATQAVIAMENARLLSELRDSLEQQTATSDILRVISQSPTDVAPVLRAVAKAALRFCTAEDVVITLREGEHWLIAGHEGPMPASLGTLHPLNRQTSPSWAILDAKTIHLPDISGLDPVEFAAAHDFSRRQGFRAAVAAPMLREDQAVGAIALRRAEPGAFTPRQIELLESFAAQAVIALENTRLFTELRQRTDDLAESLDYQTATSELLEVISRSSSDIQPVFDTMLASAARLCGVEKGDVAIQQGDAFRHVAFVGCDPEELAWLKTRVTVPGRGTSTARALLERRVDHVLDQSLDPERVAPKVATRPRTTLAVPLLRDGEPLGVISLLRDHVEPFTERQIALIETFADQAVIAMENARLLSELRERTDDLTESLEYQTATSELLEVISRSTADVQPVLDTLLSSACRLCGVQMGGVTVRRDNALWYVATLGMPAEYDKFLRETPHPIDRSTATGRATFEKAVAYIPDVEADPDYKMKETTTLGNFRSLLGVPLLREGEAIGAITLGRIDSQPFTERQIGLVRTFADQAVIAIENARLLTELRQRTDDLAESLDYQTATSEVLGVISRSPTTLQPVLEAMTAAAVRLCGVKTGGLSVRRDDRLQFVALVGQTPEFERWQMSAPIPVARGVPLGDAILDKEPVQIVDVMETEAYKAGAEVERAVVDLGGHRTLLHVPLLREDEAIGVLTVSRGEPLAFSQRQIGLIETFADQAVIAMENARLLSELRERTDDLTQSLEYQTATSELLEVVSRSAADVQPVLDAMLASAARLCEAGISGVVVKQGDDFWYQALLGGTAELLPALRAQAIRPARSTVAGHTLLTRDVVHVADIHSYPDYSIPEVLKEVRTALGVPLMREGELLGAIVLTRDHVEPFSERQIALVKTFADQAVIAIENARLLSELTRREEELRVTFDHMGDGVVMFDADLKLASWNRNFQELLDIPDRFLATRPGLEDYVRLLVERGELGHDNPDEEIERYRERASQPWSAERTRPDGRTLEVRNNPVPGGGAVLIYSDITERKKAEAEIRAARDAAEATLDKLKAAQANLVQSEKMASLGQLTAGIAHEIKNPLNFVNNFATLSVDLLDELKEVAGPALATLDDDKRAELDETMELLTGNLGKIAEHGKRADGIVRSMLSHSRGGTGDWAPSDINALVEEALNLAYHGARAQDKEFNVTLERDLEKAGKPIEVVPQDVTRVFLNLFGNGFYAANKRRLGAKQAGFKPTLKVTTRDLGDGVEVKVRDNGTGIPPDLRDKLFQPFFTTKPTGEGTGLGLSISYDIVTQQHGGTIEVESEPGVFTEFTVRLPRARRVAEARGSR